MVIEDGHIKNTLPLELTVQPSKRTEFHQKRIRIPYTQYIPSPIPKQPQAFIGPLLESALPPTKPPPEAQARLFDENPPEKRVKNPPIDNGRDGGEGGTNSWSSKRDVMTPGEQYVAMKAEEMKEYAERGLSHVVEQQRLLELRGQED